MGFPGNHSAAGPQPLSPPLDTVPAPVPGTPRPANQKDSERLTVYLKGELKLTALVNLIYFCN